MGLSEKTLKTFCVENGSEYMPQTGKKENTIKFNYMIGDQLINIKYRDARKKNEMKKMEKLEEFEENDPAEAESFW